MQKSFYFLQNNDTLKSPVSGNHSTVCGWSVSWLLILGLFLILLSSTVLFAEQVPIPTIQRVDSAGESVQTLDTVSSSVSTSIVWWASSEAIDPVQEAARFSETLGRFTSDQFEGGVRDEPGPLWQSVTVPGNLVDESVIADGTGSAWYRKVFFLPAGVTSPLALQLGEISDRDQVYLNGRLIGATGDWDSPLPQGYDQHRLYTIPDGLIRKGGANLLLIHVKGFFPYEIGVTGGTTGLGPAEQVWRNHYISNFIEVLLLVIYLTVGGYFFFLFLRRRADRENLYFALFVFGLVVYQFLRTQLKYEIGLDFFLMKRVEYLMLSTMGFTFYSFIRSYFELPRSTALKWYDRWMWIPALISLSQFLIVLISDDVLFWNLFNDKVFLPSLMFFYVTGYLGVVIYGVVIRERDARLMLGGLMVFLIAFVLDTLSHYSVLNWPRVMGYIFFFFVLSLALILANRFVRLHTEVEDLNRNLERKVAKRTEELNNTLTEVQALKVQQDGDYFLTSLLVRPLGGNFATSELASVDMVERQKKHFMFREREWEIGGDLNVAHDIQLRDRKYVVVLNGDAMGKSIQGAGGALVLGTVFKSLVNRTSHSAAVRNLFPEQWLKQSFLELQDTFVSFDGSMLVSVVIGLLDEESGLLYYLNAEHPWAVLYRKGKAEFIEEDLTLRKVGIDLEGLTDGELSVKLFEMDPGDVLIFGSDGRDDIVTGTDESGRRIINEDEKEFLRRVEEGNGQLADIEAALRRQGEFSDDFTLLRLGFRETAPYPERLNVLEVDARREKGKRAYKAGETAAALREFEAALELDDRDRESLRGAAMLSIREKDYERAADYCERYLDISPGDTSFLYYTSSVLRQLGRLETAADFGERCRLRDPAHMKNLVNLTQIYRATGNSDREAMILAKARAVDPSHPLLKA